jgi:outer membrane immunogenic protein
MRKFLLLAVLLPMLAVVGFAQESRQDISVSGAGFIPPFVAGNGVQLHATVGYGGLLSYRYMLTPRSGLELNYQYAQNVSHPLTNLDPAAQIHTRDQEISAAYVYNFTWKHFNPFLEAGIGGFIFSPIDDSKTTVQSVKKNTNIGGLYGAGIAYELSPSFDIRAEYRGIIMKAPNFSWANGNANTEKYYNVYSPVIGIAYHF